MQLVMQEVIAEAKVENDEVREILVGDVAPKVAVE